MRSRIVGQHRLRGVRNDVDGGRREWRRIRQRVTVDAAVGRVEIHEQIGIPLVEHRQRAARLRRVGVDVVAIEIPARRVLSRADQLGSVLRAAIACLRAEFLVAIGVVDRLHDQHDRVEHVLLFVEQQIAQQRLHRLFAFDFAGVDVRLDVRDRPIESPRFRRRCDRAAATR